LFLPLYTAVLWNSRRDSADASETLSARTLLKKINDVAKRIIKSKVSSHKFQTKEWGSEFCLAQK